MLRRNAGKAAGDVNSRQDFWRATSMAGCEITCQICYETACGTCKLRISGTYHVDVLQEVVNDEINSIIQNYT